MKKTNKQDEPTEENAHPIKHSFLYCINFGLISCLCTKNKFNEGATRLSSGVPAASL